MWLIPGKTKVKTEIFKGIGFLDILVCAIGVVLVTLLLLSNIPGKIIITIVLVCIFIFLILKIDGEANYMFLFHMLKHIGDKKHYEGVTFEQQEHGQTGAVDMEHICAFTDIRDDVILYGDDYYGAAIEIPAVEFRFFSQNRKTNSIVNGLGKVLRNISPDYAANIVKIDRPLHYMKYITMEYEKLDSLREAFERGAIREDELKSRVEIIYDRISELQMLENDSRVFVPCYYLVLFEKDRHQLEMQLREVLDSLRQGELSPSRLDSKELALFLKYSNNTNVKEEELDSLSPEQYAAWAMPERIDIKMKRVDVDYTVSAVKRIINYPSEVSNAWLASVMSMPGTKVVIKCKPMDREKAVRSIDRSLNELRGQEATTSVDSKLMELESHIQSLSELLETLHGENETLLQMNIYVTIYDMVMTEKWYKEQSKDRDDLPRANNFSKTVRRIYRENGLRLGNLEFQQTDGFIASQISGYDPFGKDGRGVPSNTVAAGYPWIFANVADEKGVKLGSSDGVPVFLDFFRRDSERVNSNMVIVGKSGSGKSYATKSLLTNLAADDSKIFILDPENEYAELAKNLHGKFINVGNAQFGRMNPFHIITALDDDESDGETVSGSYATHLQFLEEFFKQILPDCEKDALEYLNSMIDRTYIRKGITPETDLSKLKPTDFPVFDDLYDAILEEFQETDNQYLRTMLRTLMNYIQKFATGGRNANIWNGPSTITTEEKFTVFNFQSLLSNRNNTVANAQMLLVLKYIDNEIIKNREYNIKNNAHRKIVVVVDEAHVFIDEKFPVALDFMYQLAKRIRKYNGMQIVITQNIKDFVGTEELARKSTAIINACQYSFIFSLAPNDMDDLCKLYEKAGGINENEQEQIVAAPRGQVFTVLGPASRSSFRVDVPENVVNMFENPNFTSTYFEGLGGPENWEEFVGDSREKHLQSLRIRGAEKLLENEEQNRSEFVSLEFFEGEPEELELSFDEPEPEAFEEPKAEPEKKPVEQVREFGNAAINPDYTALAAAIAANVSGSNRTEEKLTALVEKLASDNLELRINERVESAVRARLGEAGVTDEDTAKEAPKASNKAAKKQNPVLEQGGMSLGNIFSEIDDEDDDDEFEDDEFDESEDDTDYDEFDFDDMDDDADDEDDDEDDDDDDEFMQMFSEGVNLFKSLSNIEMMEIYDDTVTEVTLDDLDKYVRNAANKGGSSDETETV